MSYSSAALATFAHILGTLDHLAGKAQKAEVPADHLAEARLADDMLPLESQFRIAVNQVYMALGRVWDMEIPHEETPLASFDDVRAMLAKARDHVAAAGERDAAAHDAEIDMTLPNGMRFVMAAHEYLRDWTMPNFYFHATTAYAILRKEGLELGKIDFVGFLARYARPTG